ncbi:MAG: hypothetical protein QOH96_5, partial [Blastocatellia bacterium]|nr:hypothetical protein [Blastocatellia bacterium]
MKGFYTNRGGLGQSAWLCAIVLSISVVGSIIASVKTPPRNITVVNNQPFRIQMPILLRGQRLGPGDWTIGKGRAVQQLGDDLVFVADLEGSSTTNLTIQQSQPSAEPDDLKVRPVEKGLSFAYKNKDLGQLSWDVVVRDAKQTEKKGLTELARPDFVATFEAIPLAFRQSATG